LEIPFELASFSVTVYVFEVLGVMVTVGADSFAVFEEYLTTILFVLVAALYLFAPANLIVIL